jgi:hypothetical protein
MGVPNGGPKWGSKSGSHITLCLEMSKCQNDKMAKWPNGAIEGVNVLKVITRPMALRAVGKNNKRLDGGARALLIQF